MSQELTLTHGEIDVNIDLYDRKLHPIWGGQQMIYRYFVTPVEGFDEVSMVVSAKVISEDTGRIELEFFDAEPTESFKLDSGSTSDEVVKDLVDNHEFLEALTEALYR
jgi:hypothetical protein